MSILIITLMTGVGFLTFGFTEAVYGTSATKFHGVFGSLDSVSNMSLVIGSYTYDFTNFKPPAAIGFDGSTNLISTVRISLKIVFQKINQHCHGLFTRASASIVTTAINFLD